MLVTSFAIIIFRNLKIATGALGRNTYKKVIRQQKNRPFLSVLSGGFDLASHTRLKLGHRNKDRRKQCSNASVFGFISSNFHDLEACAFGPKFEFRWPLARMTAGLPQVIPPVVV